MMMQIGAHMANRDLTPEHYERFGAGKFSAAKLMHTAGTKHRVEDVAVLRAMGAQHFVVRLPDSQRPDGRYPGAREYAEEMAAVIFEFWMAGVWWFQMDNEPQFQWNRLEYGPWQYQSFMRAVMSHLRSLVPQGVRLICPPLSFAPMLWKRDPGNPTPHTLDEWLSAYSWTGHRGELRPLWHLFDAASAHPYWQSERQLKDPSYGGCFQVVHQRSDGLPVVCLEWGNSLCQKQPAPPQGEIDRLMAEQYPEWLRWAHGFDYVAGSYVFILGPSTPDWRGFWVGDETLRQIAGLRRVGHASMQMANSRKMV